MRQVSSLSDYSSIVDSYHLNCTRTNCYIHEEVAYLIAHESLFVDCYSHNVFFYVKKNIGCRIYYYLNDLNQQVDFSQYKDLVIEILFRRDIPTEEVDFFLKNGFHVNLIRDQYVGVYKDINRIQNIDLGIKIKNAESIQEVELACNLFNSSFDALSGDYISVNEYHELLASKSILIAKDVDGSFLGALHQKKEGVVNVLAHIAVEQHIQGKGVGKALVCAFLDSNYMGDNTRYMLWVQRKNEAAVNLYKKIGFKFINKSTISLIK